MLVFLRTNTTIHKKMGEIHELFVLALALVWFAGATPDWRSAFSDALSVSKGRTPDKPRPVFEPIVLVEPLQG